jgi:hypothetical protein
MLDFFSTPKKRFIIVMTKPSWDASLILFYRKSQQKKKLEYLNVFFCGLIKITAFLCVAIKTINLKHKRIEGFPIFSSLKLEPRGRN